MDATTPPTPEATSIALPRIFAVVITLVTLVLGVLLGLFLPTLLAWSTSLPWLPMQGPLELLARVTAGAPGSLLPVLGGVLGVLAGLAVVSACTTITVTDRDLVVRQGSKRTRWARAQVEAAVVEHGHLSLRDARDVDLTRESVDGDTAALVDALRRHGWPVRQES